MGRKERKPRESAPCVPNFGTQGTTGAAHGGQRSRRGRGPRMAWPPSAVLEGGAHKRSAVGRIARRGVPAEAPCLQAPARRARTRPSGPCPAATAPPVNPPRDLRENEKRPKRSSGGSPHSKKLRPSQRVRGADERQGVRPARGPGRWPSDLTSSRSSWWRRT